MFTKEKYYCTAQNKQNVISQVACHFHHLASVVFLYSYLEFPLHCQNFGHLNCQHYQPSANEKIKNNS